MADSTPEERLEELLCLLEQHRKFSDSLGTLSEAELAEYRTCCHRIEELIMLAGTEQTESDHMAVTGFDEAVG